MNIFPPEIQSNMFVTKLPGVNPIEENMTYDIVLDLHVKAFAVEKLQEWPPQEAIGFPCVRNSWFQPVPKLRRHRTLLSQTAKMMAWHVSENLRKGKKCHAAAARKKSKKNVRETVL